MAGRRSGARAMLGWSSDGGLLRSDARGRHQIGLEAGQQRCAQSAGTDHDVEHGRDRVFGEGEHERCDDQDDRRRDLRDAVQDRRQDPMMPVDQFVPIASRVAAPPRTSINTVAVSS
jgi:hypothetical protein